MKYIILSASQSVVIFLTTGLLINSSPLLAANNDLFFNIPVALSANRLDQPVSDAAVTISVIDRATIEASGARTIPEVLRLVPGVQVGYSGNEFGDEPKYVVTYHGHSDQYSKQLQVLIDGRSIYEPFFGGILWKAIPVNIDDIERIEFSRGPNLATYGGNSFLGAINIITRTAAEDQGSYARTNIGNHDIADLTYRYGGNRGKLDYRITASTLNDNGLNSANQFDNPDDTNSHKIDYRADYQYNDRNTLSYQGGYGINFQQTDRNHADVLPAARTVENTHFYQFIKWEDVINKKNTTLLQYYYNLSNKEDNYTSAPINLNSFFPGVDTFRLNVNAKIKTQRHNFEFTHFIYPSDNFKFTWGLSAQFDLVDSPLYLGTDNTITHKQYRGFSNIEWHINRNNIINTGGLLENNDFTDTSFSPRLSFIHVFNHHNKIRLGISHAIRSPFILEERANTGYSHALTTSGSPVGVTVKDQIVSGNSNLHNQKITSREMAYYGSFIHQTLLFDARLFYDNITDFIDIQRLPTNNPAKDFDNSIQKFTNAITSRTRGLELELDYHIDATLRLIASSALIDISSNSGVIADSAPQHSYSLLLSKQFEEKYNASLYYYYADAFKWTDAAHDSYNILNLKLGRNFNYGQTHGNISLVLKNLAGDYSDYKSRPRTTTAPRIIQNKTAYIDLRLNF